MHLTHNQLRKCISVVQLEDLATWWVCITDRSGTPRFEIKRGSLFIFENENLPRVTWGVFSNMSMNNKQLLLENGVHVLTCGDEDTFLVRLAESNHETLS